MGSDFSSHQFFAGAGDARRHRTVLIEGVRRFMGEAGFREVATEAEAHRSFVIGPPERWIHVGDSAASDGGEDPEGFEHLSRALSALGPVVDIHMSDDAVVHFYLYRDSRLVDTFGSGQFPCCRFESAKEAAPFRGKPKLWAELLRDHDGVAALRSVWQQVWNATEILDSTAALFGWHPELAWVGYSHDIEGIFLRYDDYLREIEAEIDLEGFEELHFQSATPAGREGS